MKRVFGALLAAACMGLSGTASAAPPTIVISEPQGVVSSLYQVDFYADCGLDGENWIWWSLDGTYYGKSGFYGKFASAHYYKAPPGGHVFTVEVQCASDPTIYSASSKFVVSP